MNPSTEQVKEIKERCEKATAGPWEWSTFTHHSGRDIETNVDVAETVAFSAMQSERAQLFGAALKEKDAEGRNIVVCYTGNGPNAHNNAEFISAAKTDIPLLLSAISEKEKETEIEIAIRDSILSKLERLAPNVIVNGNAEVYAEAIVQAAESSLSECRKALEKVLPWLGEDFSSVEQRNEIDKLKAEILTALAPTTKEGQ